MVSGIGLVGVQSTVRIGLIPILDIGLFQFSSGGFYKKNIPIGGKI